MTTNDLNQRSDITALSGLTEDFRHPERSPLTSLEILPAAAPRAFARGNPTCRSGFIPLLVWLFRVGAQHAAPHVRTIATSSATLSS